MQTAPYVIDRRNDLFRSGYVVVTTCRNCGEKHASLFSKGQEVRPADKEERCPYCECGGLLYFGSMKDGAALALHPKAVVLYDDPRQGFVGVTPLPVSIVAPLSADVVPTAPATCNAKIYDA